MKKITLAAKFRKMPWSTVTKVLNSIGWEVEIDKKNLKRYGMGMKKLAIVNVGKNKWKVDYYVDGKLMDSAGIMDEEFAKIMTGELGWLRGIKG